MSVEIFHPGVFLDEELEARGWSATDLARRSNIPVPIIEQIIAGREPVTHDRARSLADAFGTGAEYWTNLQMAFERHHREHFSR